MSVIVTCPNCGARNRVDERASARRPVCGKCGTALKVPHVPGDEPVEVSDDTFTSEVLGAGDKPVLLDCWAPWCGPCRLIAPAIGKLAANSGGRYVVAKLNVDDNPRTATQFQIQSIPTLLIFKAGKLVERMVGAQSGDAIAERLMTHVSA